MKEPEGRGTGHSGELFVLHPDSLAKRGVLRGEKFLFSNWDLIELTDLPSCQKCKYMGSLTLSAHQELGLGPSTMDLGKQNRAEPILQVGKWRIQEKKRRLGRLKHPPPPAQAPQQAAGRQGAGCSALTSSSKVRSAVR